MKCLNCTKEMNDAIKSANFIENEEVKCFIACRSCGNVMTANVDLEENEAFDIMPTLSDYKKTTRNQMKQAMDLFKEASMQLSHFAIREEAKIPIENIDKNLLISTVKIIVKSRKEKR